MPDKDPLDAFLDEVAKLLHFTHESIANLEKQKPKNADKNAEQLSQQLEQMESAVKIFLEVNAALLPHNPEDLKKIEQTISNLEQIPEDRRRIIERSKVLQKEVEEVQKDFTIASEIAKIEKEVKKEDKKESKTRKKKFRRVDDDKWKRI